MRGFPVAEPYYADDSVTLYHGDCLEIDAWLAADVLVTDPPYGSRFTENNPMGGYGRRQNHGDGRTSFTIANDDDPEVRDCALAAWGNRPAAVFASPRLNPPPIEWANRIVWDKKTPGLGGTLRYVHEDIYLTAGWGRVGTGFSILSVNNPRDNFGHVHHKPEPLLAQVIGGAPEGVIADPFAGTGSTLVAAKRLGRRAIGVELEERYCEVIAKRLAQGVLDFGGIA